MDTLKSTFECSIFNEIKNEKTRSWFNPTLSWKNKYKDGIPPQEAFFGSTTFLVSFTDGWHLIQKIFLTAMFILIVIHQPIFNQVADFLILYLIFTVSFELFYRILKK